MKVIRDVTSHAEFAAYRNLDCGRLYTLEISHREALLYFHLTRAEAQRLSDELARFVEESIMTCSIPDCPKHDGPCNDFTEKER